MLVGLGEVGGLCPLPPSQQYVSKMGATQDRCTTLGLIGLNFPSVCCPCLPACSRRWGMRRRTTTPSPRRTTSWRGRCRPSSPMTTPRRLGRRGGRGLLAVRAGRELLMLAFWAAGAPVGDCACCRLWVRAGMGRTRRRKAAATCQVSPFPPPHPCCAGQRVPRGQQELAQPHTKQRRHQQRRQQRAQRGRHCWHLHRRCVAGLRITWWRQIHTHKQ